MGAVAVPSSLPWGSDPGKAHLSPAPRLGILYAPLLPAVQILKLLLLFYIKKVIPPTPCSSPRGEPAVTCHCQPLLQQWCHKASLVLVEPRGGFWGQDVPKLTWLPVSGREGTAGRGLLSRSWQPTGHCSLSTDQPDEELPVPQQALASITHEHHIHHSAVLPLLPGCSCLPLLHHLDVSTPEATAQDCQLPGEGGVGDTMAPVPGIPQLQA